MTEVEIKLAIGPAQLEVRRLEDLSADLMQPRGYEENVLLDLPGMPLRARGAILRVRKFAGTSTLTYKEPEPGPPGFKVRREVETVIEDAETMIRILESAGFGRIWGYVKYRTVYSLGDLKIFLDETPIGNFLELEGKREAIDAFAARLGRSPDEYIDESYGALYEQWCRERGVALGDLRFEQGTI